MRSFHRSVQKLIALYAPFSFHIRFQLMFRSTFCSALRSVFRSTFHFTFCSTFMFALRSACRSPYVTNFNLRTAHCSVQRSVTRFNLISVVRSVPFSFRSNLGCTLTIFQSGFEKSIIRAYYVLLDEQFP